MWNSYNNNLLYSRYFPCSWFNVNMAKHRKTFCAVKKMLPVGSLCDALSLRRMSRAYWRPSSSAPGSCITCVGIQRYLYITQFHSCLISLHALLANHQSGCTIIPVTLEKRQSEKVWTVHTVCYPSGSNYLSTVIMCWCSASPGYKPDQPRTSLKEKPRAVCIQSEGHADTEQLSGSILDG